MNDQEIIDNAPEGAAIFSDAEDLYVKWVKPLTGIYKKEGDKYGLLYWHENLKEWEYVWGVYAGRLLGSSRSLADIKRIIELEANQVRAETLIFELHEQVYDSSYLDEQVKLYEALKEPKP
jgi:hypothetical protein